MYSSTKNVLKTVYFVCREKGLGIVLKDIVSETVK